MTISRKLIIAAFALSATATFAGANKHVNTSADAQTVKQVQQALNDKGFDAGQVDGIAGPRTNAALQKYQQSQGVNASGSIDTQTLASLGVSGSMNASADASAPSSFSPRNDQAAAPSATQSMEPNANAATSATSPSPSDATSMSSTQANPAADQAPGATSNAGTNQPQTSNSSSYK